MQFAALSLGFPIVVMFNQIVHWRWCVFVFFMCAIGCSSVAVGQEIRIESFAVCLPASERKCTIGSSVYRYGSVGLHLGLHRCRGSFFWRSMLWRSIRSLLPLMLQKQSYRCRLLHYQHQRQSFTGPFVFRGLFVVTLVDIGVRDGCFNRLQKIGEKFSLV